MTRIVFAAVLSASILFVGPSARAADDVPEAVFGHVADGKNIVFENPFTGAAWTIDLPQTWKFAIGGTEIDLSPTRHTVILWFSTALMVLILSLAARKRSMVPRGFYSLIEVLFNFIRVELAEKNIGKEKSEQYVPFLATLFFLILVLNLMGAIPYSATATANLAVTGGLALTTFFVTMYAGMKEQGSVGYWTGIVPQGVPSWLYPIMIPVELLGMLTKPFALTIRLFANMAAGHIVLFFLLGLIFLLGSAGAFVAPISVAFATGMFFLELFVALLQAYIFALLSALFIGMASHPH